MKNLFQALSSFNNQQDYILAVITDTQGSTYQKAGAMMIIDSNYNYWGLLTGGCLEADLHYHCQQVFSQQVDQQLVYDLRSEDDLVWGMGLGCEGALNLLLKFLPAQHDHYHFFHILQKVADGEAYQMQIKTSGSFLIPNPTLQEGKKNISDKEEPSDYQNAINLKSDNIFTITFSNSHKANVQPQLLRQNNQQLLQIPLTPPHHLLICGATPDVTPVTAIAKQLGWKVSVIDHRPSYAQPQNFPAAHQVNLVKRSQWKNYDLTTVDSVVIMSHHYEQDKAYLHRLLNTPIPYIGLLGPAQRRDKLLKACATNIHQQQQRIYGPVGLPIGATSPESIALAIVAEIQSVLSQRSANQPLSLASSKVITL
ncbi:XdhC family protein [Aliikangiella maris]|uniref:XdhC family protein n=2 Tax=Aliikangiella maris TaxID=3162458 RepID=A0ABV3MPD5_9GAMM